MLFRSNSIYKDGIEVLIDKSDPLIVPGSDTKLLVKGPFGLGVTMNKFKEGIILCISYGKNISLFIDLVTYILRHNIFRAGKLLKKSYTIFGNENLEKLNGEKFKMLLVAFYESKEEAIGNDICVETNKVTKEFMFGNFEYIEKIGSECENLNDILNGVISSEVTHIVCATPEKVADKVKDTVVQAGIKQSTMMYL